MVVLSELSKGSSSSSSTHGRIYDVFLSFRGLDTRNNFTAYLRKALLDANITTFYDDKEIETGEDLKPELKSAIKASRASIIVLSKNYANSSWCLDELVLIFKERKKSNQIVIPVFYHVEPTNVRKQESSFGDAIAKHRRVMEEETDENKKSKWAQKIDRWINALKEVADLKGKDVNGRIEMEFIEEIVNDIYHRLRVPLKSPPPLLIGMEDSITFVTSWLKDASSHTTDILTILGIGGIGKTSLAKYVYLLHCREFETSSFIGNISRRCVEKFSGLLELQKQLYDDISKRNSIPTHDVSIYTSNIENAIACKKMFLVLDDVDSLEQLDALLGSKGFHPRSKIIITTKDAWLTESCAVFKMNVKPKHEKHFLRGLQHNASQKLLCFHAFMSDDPKEGYEEVSTKFVKYCNGHPLALEVLGKSLHNRDIPYWEDRIEMLKKEPSSPIDSVLKMSFDSLPSENDKDLFKHIACFFVGTDRDFTEMILKECDINTRSGITNLIDKCLISIGWENELMMHELLQKMGRSVVHQESPDKPWMRSRLCCHEESLKVLEKNKGTENILGLVLDTQKLKKEKLRISFKLKTDSLKNMDNLMLLQLNYVQISRSYANFPKKLRWLCMHGFLLKSIPLDLPMENLVALDMSYSNLESFDICCSNPQQLQKREKLIGSYSKGKRLLGSLKILNLSFSEQLCSIGGFDQLPALERLILTNCSGLFDVCESIKQCVELVLVDMSYCNKLEKLPKGIGMLKKVKTLVLEGCNLGGSRIEILDMNSSEMPKANHISISTITSSSMVLKAIPSYSKFFVINLPRSLVRLSLGNNNLFTKSFPMDFSCLSMLKELYLDENPIVSLPNCVRSLPSLKILSMKNCNMLKSVEHPPHTLTHLNLYLNSDKKLLRKVVFDPQMSPLNLLLCFWMFATSSFEIEGMMKIQPMASVEEKLLHSLGWNKLEFLYGMHVAASSSHRDLEESEIQMYYEFGIFSTIYGGEVMPNWIADRSTGPSMSFTIPSSPNKLRGLNFCYVLTSCFENYKFHCLQEIIISNITKNRTWIYNHHIKKIDVGGRFMTLLSHWIFGMNEMECGDCITITVRKNPFDVCNLVTKECGVSFVYNDGDTDEEDVLEYYKSWNHIIGGDLTTFQLKTGEYFLNLKRILLPLLDMDLRNPSQPCGEGARFKDNQVNFRAFSQRMIAPN